MAKVSGYIYTYNTIETLYIYNSLTAQIIASTPSLSSSSTDDGVYGAAFSDNKASGWVAKWSSTGIFSSFCRATNSLLKYSLS